RPLDEALDEVMQEFHQSGTVMEPAAVAAALAKLDQLVGRAEDDNLGGRSAGLSGILRESIRPLVNELGKRLSSLPVQLLERPEYRLASAEEAIRQTVVALDQALQQQERQGKEATARAAECLESIRQLVGNWQKSPPSGKRAAAASAEIAGLLVEYPSLCFQKLLALRAASVYVSLRGHLSDELREVGYCRTQLAELLRLFDADDEAEAPSLAPISGRRLLPAACASLQEVVDKTVKGTTAEDLLALDQKVQAMIQHEFKSLIYVCQ